MIKWLRFNWLLLGSIALQQCAPVYVPNTINSGMVNNKGDIAGAVHLSNAIDLQFAYALDSHFMAFSSYQNYNINPTTVSFSNGSTTEIGGSRSNMIELGGGYYTRFGSQKRGVFEGLGGGGVGRSSSEQSVGTYAKVFLQPSLGFIGKRFEALYSLKPAWVVYENKSSELDEGIPNPLSDFFIENAITMRLGGPNIKFTSQMALSLPTNEGIAPYEFMPVRVSAGFIFRFNLTSNGVTKRPK